MNPRILHHKVPRTSIISESEVSITVLCMPCLPRYTVVSPADHKGLVTRNTNACLNAEAIQRLHDIINYVIVRSESMTNHGLGFMIMYKTIIDIIQLVK